MLIQPYLFFNGRCEEALGFYAATLGAKIEMMMRMKDSPEPPPPGSLPPGAENKIMHAAFTVGGSLVMASDGMASGPATFEGFRLAITVADVATCERTFAALADGGQVDQPLVPTFFAPSFGMCTDRFGMRWMVLAEQPPA